MTPKQFADHLRSVASRLDRSQLPSRSAVASELRKLVATLREASRNDVARLVDSVFQGLGIYPPNMDSQGGNVYKGDIDTGWTLEVTEAGGGMRVKLNGVPCKDVMAAAKAYKAKDPKYAGGPSAAPAGSSQQEWEEKFYPGAQDMVASGDWYAGSQAFWSVFKDLGWLDWTPASDPAEVEHAMRDNFKSGKFVGDEEGAVKEMYDNYQTYKDHFEKKYMDGTINDTQ